MRTLVDFAHATASTLDPEAMTQPRIECRAVSKVLQAAGERLQILNGIDFSVEDGESIAILGPSGSGKSTLLGLMAGLDRATTGSVLLDGVPLEDKSEDQLALLRRGRVGFVFQAFHLLPNLNAIENVRIPLELIGRTDARERSAELLERVGLSDRALHYPNQLSGGEMQRIAIARAFGARPSLMFADEPTGNLDFATGGKVLDLLMELREVDGMTMVLVTHDEAVAARATRRIHLHAGSIDRIES